MRRRRHITVFTHPPQTVTPNKQNVRTYSWYPRGVPAVLVQCMSAGHIFILFCFVVSDTFINVYFIVESH